MDGPILYFFVALILILPLAANVIRTRQREARARIAAERGEMFSEGPKAQHPHIDAEKCIGCGSCVDVCPEGDVLAVVAGKAAIVNGYKCVGHSLCAEVCPVGAIEMVMAGPSMGADMPVLTPEYETNIRNLFVAGELGGLALIKNAVLQGVACVDTIAARIGSSGRRPENSEIHDVCIVGAGPAGISASLRAIEKKLKYVTIEQDVVGGTVAKYPRQKLVMTSPVQFPMYGTFKKLELSKEDLLAFWAKVAERADFRISTCERVEDIRKGADDIFAVHAAHKQYLARSVILTMGRRGTPRKLGIPGEELPKVMYSLIEADAYSNRRILIIGGGDSAVEAAMGLARQHDNEVVISYRRERFSRLKERNRQRVAECILDRKLKVIFKSNPVEIKERSVVLDIDGVAEELPNDFVWIFAGGSSPNEFLEKIGVRRGARDMTREAGIEAGVARQSLGISASSERKDPLQPIGGIEP
jgi:thioredoxin reductase (NADPH)